MTVSHHNAHRESDKRAEGGAQQGATVDFGDNFKQEITQALQPTLEEFRQRMAKALSEEMAAMPQLDAAPADADQTAESPEAAKAASGREGEGGGKQEQEQGQPQGRVQEQEQGKGQEQGRGQEQEQGKGHEQEAHSQPLAIAVRNALPEMPKLGDLGSLPNAAQTMGRAVGQWVQSLLIAGLVALLSESSHVAVQQRAEQGLTALLQKAFDAMPAEFASQEIRQKTEDALRSILRDALESVYTDGTRESLQRDGQQTVMQALNGDIGGAVGKVEDTLQVLMTALLAAVRRNQQTIFRLLLAFALLAVDYSLVRSDKAS